jgi:subtilisin family serine protease
MAAMNDERPDVSQDSAARHSSRWFVVAALAALMTVLAVPGAASAEPLDPWWYSALSVDENHEQATGKGVKIAVIDGALNADAPDLKGANVTLRQALRDGGTGEMFPATSYPKAFYASHGTTMVTLIAGQGTGNAPGGAGIRGIAPDAEVYFYQMDPDPTDDSFEYSYALFKQAIKDDVDIISFSIGSETGLASVIQEAWDAGIVVVAGAGKKNGLILEPASIPGVVVVGAVDKDARPWKDQPQGAGSITVTAPGVDVPAGSMKGTRTNARWVSGTERTGTSDATPLVAGALALVKQKYPDATGNQLIQQLIHHTDRDAFSWQSELGYGVMRIDRMLATDPTGWPDVNPLLNGPDAARADFPSTVYRDPAAPQPTTATPTTPAPEPTGEAPTPAVADDESGSSALPWVIAGAVVVIALGAALVIVVRRRQDRRS